MRAILPGLVLGFSILLFVSVEHVLGFSASAAAGPPFFARRITGPVPTSPTRRVSTAVFGAGPAVSRSDGNFSSLLPLWSMLVAADVCQPRLSGGSSWPIPVDPCDATFDPGCVGGRSLPFTRAVRDDFGNPLLDVSPDLDLGFIYGSTAARTLELRALHGGRLRTWPAANGSAIEGGDLPPPAGPAASTRFAFGADVVNAHPGTAALAALLIREHNRYAAALNEERPGLGDDALFDAARAFTTAVYQRVTFTEWLPALVGEARAAALFSSSGATAAPGVSAEFCSAMNFSLALLPGVVPLRLAETEDPSSAVTVLRDSLFDGSLLLDGGLAALLYGAARWSMRSPGGATAVPDIRSAGGDWVSHALQRARDLGVADYDTVRSALGVPAQRLSVSEQALAAAYGAGASGPGRLIDLLVGGLGEERPATDTVVLGPTLAALVSQQFAAFALSPSFLFNPVSALFGVTTEADTLAAVALRNTDVRAFPSSAFIPGSPLAGEVPQPFPLEGLPAPLEGQQAALLTDWFSLGWKVSADKTKITFTCVASLDGFVGVGFRARGGGGMDTADLVIGRIPPGSPAGAPGEVLDYHGTPGVVEPSPDAHNDLEDTSFTCRAGSCTLGFTRRLVTGDPEDMDLSIAEPTSILYAVGPHSLRGGHLRGNRGSYQLLLGPLADQPAKGRTWSLAIWIHVIGMIACWVMLAPWAIISAKYLKVYTPLALSMHKFAMGVCLGAMTPLLIVAFVSSFTSRSETGRTPMQMAHFVLSWIFFILFVAQFLLGNLLNSQRNSATYARKYYFFLFFFSLT